MSSCDIITENGDKCVYKSIFVKDGENINCKNYCHLHFNKIIFDLRKEYLIVNIDEVECKISDTLTKVKNKNIKHLSDKQLLNIFNTVDNIPVSIVTDSLSL